MISVVCTHVTMAISPLPYGCYCPPQCTHATLSLFFPLDPPAVMVRLDAASLSSLHPPSFQLDLHGLLMDNMTLQSPEPAFLCSPIASLPEGVGVAVLTTVGVKYDSTIKVGGWPCSWRVQTLVIIRITFLGYWSHSQVIIVSFQVPFPVVSFLNLISC